MRPCASSAQSTCAYFCGGVFDGLGVGLDYRSSRHIVWTADYAFARDNAPPTPQNDTHTVMVGVRVTR